MCLQQLPQGWNHSPVSVKDCRSKFRKSLHSLEANFFWRLLHSSVLSETLFHKSAVLHPNSHLPFQTLCFLSGTLGIPRNNQVNLHWGSVHVALWLLAETVTLEGKHIYFKIKNSAYLLAVSWNSHHGTRFPLFLAPLSFVDPHLPKCPKRRLSVCPLHERVSAHRNDVIP